MTLRQGKYAREVLETFGYDNAHAVGNPMETNVRLMPLGDNEESDTGFEYREAIGMHGVLCSCPCSRLTTAADKGTNFIFHWFRIG